MKTFILMSSINPQTASPVSVVTTMRDCTTTARSWVDRARKLVPEAAFVAHFALLGSYDFMDIYHAPDEETAAKVAWICCADGTFKVESWTAIPEARMQELANQLAEGIQKQAQSETKQL
ncbi:GYD domain-containing protein [candidate division GN15 bacterium]|nr:GYD domain-containing protein [candidate division GN15 bacterium]